MSVRIHQLSKEIGMENKELIQLLLSRGFEVKSASSTVDNISADSLREEFASAGEAAAPVVEAEAVAAESEAITAPSLPAGVIVKSAEDIKREREDREKALIAAAKPTPTVPAPTVP
ncbi:MAG: translation initiation factor IF-2, partial [Lentimonas sp.]